VLYTLRERFKGSGCIDGVAYREGSSDGGAELLVNRRISTVGKKFGSMVLKLYHRHLKEFLSDEHFHTFSM
jgi:hypothetical protein